MNVWELSELSQFARDVAAQIGVEAREFGQCVLDPRKLVPPDQYDRAVIIPYMYTEDGHNEHLVLVVRSSTEAGRLLVALGDAIRAREDDRGECYLVDSPSGL